MTRSTLKRSGLILLLILGACAFVPLVAQDVDIAASAERIADRYGQGSLADAWRGARAIEDLGDDAIPWAQNTLDGDRATLRLMAAKALLSMGEEQGVQKVLVAIAADEGVAAAERAAAIQLLSDFPGAKVEKLLRGILEGEGSYDPALRVAAGRSLFAVSHDWRTARNSLIPLLDVDDAAVRGDAALVLGEMGLVDGKVKSILRSLEKEPTSLGAQARLILENDLLMRKLERATEPAQDEGAQELVRRLGRLERDLEERERALEELRKGGLRKVGHPLIDEILARIDEYYADPGRVDRNDLMLAAAKGLVASLDPFSSYMDAKETRDFYEGISGEYAGIGAQVAKDRDSGFLMILRPIYKGPAYREGLLTNDKIAEVEGVTTKGFRLEEVVKKLKGPPGTPVSIKVIRRGWREPREFTITRQLIQLDSVQHAMLPGRVGYLRLSQFGDTAIEEVERGLDALEADGMRGLILDLRNNPGGYLQAAVDLVDNFVGERKRPIVSQRAENDHFPPAEKFATSTKRPDYPIVVIVNSASASASEIVSGALQDFGRASILGTKTFGKGSVQRLFTMPRHINQLLGGETTLRLTVQYYYLPSGRSIHARRDPQGKVTREGGVTPDIEVTPEEIALWREEAISKLIDEDAFEEYIDRYYEPNRVQFARIAEHGDGGGLDAYPGLEAFFDARNKYHAKTADIRSYLRQLIRRRVEDERGRQFACDFPEDTQLQRAILEILKKVNENAEEYPEYRDFAREFGEQKKL